MVQFSGQKKTTSKFKKIVAVFWPQDTKPQNLFVHHDSINMYFSLSHRLPPSEVISEEDIENIANKFLCSPACLPRSSSAASCIVRCGVDAHPSSTGSHRYLRLSQHPQCAQSQRNSINHPY
jgi:hypothetical protein